MVILLQGGLIQVYQVLPVLQLLYCKSVDDPEQEDNHDNSDEFYISTDLLKDGYKTRRAMKYTDLDITISTKVLYMKIVIDSIHYRFIHRENLFCLYPKMEM